VAERPADYATRGSGQGIDLDERRSLFSECERIGAQATARRGRRQGLDSSDRVVAIRLAHDPVSSGLRASS
jgi:hypothetical protein